MVARVVMLEVVILVVVRLVVIRLIVAVLVVVKLVASVGDTARGGDCEACGFQVGEGASDGDAACFGGGDNRGNQSGKSGSWKRKRWKRQKKKHRFRMLWW